MTIEASMLDLGFGGGLDEVADAICAETRELRAGLMVFAEPRALVKRLFGLVFCPV